MQNIRQTFKDIEWRAVVVHWDGKLLPNMLSREMQERLPVLVSSGKTNKILGVPQIDSSTGESIAEAIFEVMVDWSICDSVKAICCDTTPSNLGCRNGAAILLERLLKKNLLYLPCRHHLFELILRAVFECKIPSTTGPNVPMFKRFRDAWSGINQNQFNTGIENEHVFEILKNHIDNINTFAQNYFDTVQPREDYKELLCLVQIFIGKVPRESVKFRRPGAYHHARWMAKAIYVLKMFLFREQFKLQSKEAKAICEISTFIVMIYVEAWF